MLALSLLIIVAGGLVFRFNRGIGDLKKATDEEWGMKSTQASGYAFFAKVAGVAMILAGIAMLLARLLPQ